MDLTQKDNVVALMKSSTNEQDWNKNCDAVKQANSGDYPSFWYAAIILSGVCDATLGGGASQIRIETWGQPRTWTDDMGEISGFGGGYEQACRDMTEAGIVWLENHPNAEPVFSHSEGGNWIENNEDADGLEAAMLVAEPDPSGAMFGASCGIARWVHANSWEAFQVAKREKEAEKRSAQAEN